MTLNIKTVGIIVIALLVAVISVLFINSNSSADAVVALSAEAGIASKPLNTEVEWLFVNKATNQVVTKKTIKGVGTINLNKYESSEKNSWSVSVKSELYSGVAQLTNSDLQSGVFKIYLSKIQSATDVELFVQKSAEATTNIPIKWNIEKDVKAKINMQKEGEEALFYAPPNLFTVNYKNNETMLRMPSEAGKYIIRVYDTLHINEPLKEVIIEVLETDIEIIAPTEAFAGTNISLKWKAPKSSQGQINLRGKSEEVKNYLGSYLRTREKPSIDMVLPSIAGEYVLSWVDFYSKRLVFEKTINVKKADITLTTADKAEVNQSVLVKWSAPKSSVGSVHLKSVADKKIYVNFSVSGGKTEANILMPDKAGKYYLAWIGYGDKKEMARHDIEVLAKD